MHLEVGGIIPRRKTLPKGLSKVLSYYSEKKCKVVEVKQKGRSL